MPGEEFAAGLTLFAATGGAAGTASWTLISRRLGHLDRLERLVAGMVVFLAAVVGIHVLPLILGILSRPSVIAMDVLVVLAALRIARVEPAPDPPRRTAPPSPMWANALSGAVALTVLAVVATNVREWLPRIFTGLDTLTFHLPNAASWIHTGSLWQIDQFLPGETQGYYPGNGEVLQVWAMLPFDNEFLVRWVFVGLLAAWFLTIVAVARELGVTPATRVLAACALVTIPIVGISTVPRAMPDVLLYTTMTAAALFLLRHARTGRRSDLVLAGVGLGLGMGTKWYGVTTTLVVGVVWAVSRVRASPAWRIAGREVALLTGVTAAAGGIWLLRNLVESGNPVFPAKVAPLGVTIFDAPSDGVREQLGFSIAHYFGDPGVLFDDIPREILDGAGLVVLVGAAFILLAAVTAWRSRDLLLGAVTACAVLLAAAYAVTPYSALGFEGHPDSASVNTRYLVGALVCATLAGSMVLRRGVPAVIAQLGLAGAALVALNDAYGPLRAGPISKTVVALVLVGALAVVARGTGARLASRAAPRTRRTFVVGALVLVTVLTAVYAGRAERRFNGDRYVRFDPTFEAIEKLEGDGDHRVGLVNRWSLGLSPVWPAFGERLANRVHYVGFFRRGMLTEYPDKRSFIAAVRRGRFDVLVVGRGLRPAPQVPEEAWAAEAGFVAVTHSKRLILFVSPALRARLA